MARETGAGAQPLDGPIGPSRRIVVLGAESTGSTTLAEDLAHELDAPLVPEFLRQYARERAAEAGSIWAVTWTSADFDRVADGQDALEADVVAAWGADIDRSQPTATASVIICDTDALATALWHRRYVGASAPRFVRRAASRPPDLYLLTSPEGVDFVQDGLRDGEHLRLEMTGWFRETLAGRSVPWLEVAGDRSTRLRVALEAVEQVTDG
jgi:nicotinamide riboside kinase